MNTFNLNPTVPGGFRLGMGTAGLDTNRPKAHGGPIKFCGACAAAIPCAKRKCPHCAPALQGLIKCFSMEHTLSGMSSFTEETAPDWLTGKNSFPGSTVDNRWLWNDHVLTLQVGQSMKTSLCVITRTR